MKLTIKSKFVEAKWLDELNNYLELIYRGRDIESTEAEYTRLHCILEIELGFLMWTNSLKNTIAIDKKESEVILKENTKVIIIYTIE